jgi:hypothetical protein
VALVPALYHFDERHKIALMVLVRLAHNGDVFLRVSLKPEVTDGVGDEVAAASAIEADHNIHHEIRKADGDGLAVAADVRRGSVGLPERLLHLIEKFGGSAINPIEGVVVEVVKANEDVDVCFAQRRNHGRAGV